MATTKTTAPRLEAPQSGKCRRVINGKRHMAPVPADHPNWTWCRACVDEDRAAKKAAKSKTTPKAKTPAKSKTPAAAVAAAAAKVDADPMTRELAAVKAMKDAAAK